MKTLQYSFAQIEAFATIAETGSLSQAAIRLAKDRTTLRDLLDYLEDALGYRLFSREGRSLTLTAEGEQLFRQAHLLLRQAQAFESFAQTLPQTAGQALRLVYDPFVPREFLCALADNLARRQIRLSCWSASRREAEQALSDGVAEMAICQANNRTLGSEMEWRALGTVDLRFYAADSLFHDAPRPLTLLNLSLTPQLVMHRRSDDQIARRLQISGHTLYMNEITLLRHALEQGEQQVAVRQVGPGISGQRSQEQSGPCSGPDLGQSAGTVIPGGQSAVFAQQGFSTHGAETVGGDGCLIGTVAEESPLPVPRFQTVVLFGRSRLRRAPGNAQE